MLECSDFGVLEKPAMCVPLGAGEEKSPGLEKLHH